MKTIINTAAKLGKVEGEGERGRYFCDSKLPTFDFKINWETRSL